MYNVGLDFGSTYSCVSVYNDKTGEPVSKLLNETMQNPAVPTVLQVSKNNKIKIGHAAKGRSFSSQTYRAFKMLLAENRKDVLADWGFDDSFAPADAAKLFIGELLSQIAKRDASDRIDNLVIGVPEIWLNELVSSDICTKLINACSKIDIIDSENVRVVSEPVAASAFFANNYYKITKKLFNGHLLLVDYGGGTLDITLTAVQPSTGNTGSIMEIRPVYKTGAGENQPNGLIGTAGLAYMERLLQLAVEEITGETPEHDSNFSSALDDLERVILSMTDSINEVFTTFGSNPKMLTEDIFEMQDEEFYLCELNYFGLPEPVPVSYGMMAKAYDEVIRPVFESKLQEVQSYMAKHGIDWKSGIRKENDTEFKIMLVGGFGNFSLVRKQMDDSFKSAADDCRFTDIETDKADCELAISKGAALVSEGIITIKNTVRFSIGVYATLGNKDSYANCYGLVCGEEFEPDKEYIQCDKNGAPIVIMSGGSFEYFLIDKSADHINPGKIGVNPKFADELNKRVTSETAVCVGFSLSRSNVISLHIHDYDLSTDTISQDAVIKTLANFEELFGGSVWEPLKKPSEE